VLLAYCSGSNVGFSVGSSGEVNFDDTQLTIVNLNDVALWIYVFFDRQPKFGIHHLLPHLSPSAIQ